MHTTARKALHSKIEYLIPGSRLSISTSFNTRKQLHPRTRTLHQSIRPQPPISRMTHTYIKGPESKFDHATIAHLDTLPVEQWKRLIPDLVWWLCDSNWPIFTPVRDLLLKNPNACLPEIRKVLEIPTDAGEDDFQYWVLTLLILRMPVQCRRELAPDLAEFRTRVSDEIDEAWDMREAVDEILKSVPVVEKGDAATANTEVAHS